MQIPPALAEPHRHPSTPTPQSRTRLKPQRAQQGVGVRQVWRDAPRGSGSNSNLPKASCPGGHAQGSYEVHATLSQISACR
jgi:hypothetical protein